MQLTWRDGDKSDRARLIRFRCTRDFRRTLSNRSEQHPRYWEHEVQSWFRRNAKPPRRHPSYLLVGLLGEDIKATAAWSQIDGPAIVQLEFMAVSHDCRGRGVADDLMSHTLDELAGALGQTGEVAVFASIHERNAASQRMAERFAFECIDASGSVHQWGRLLPVEVNENAESQRK